MSSDVLIAVVATNYWYSDSCDIATLITDALIAVILLLITDALITMDVLNLQWMLFITDVVGCECY